MIREVIKPKSTRLTIDIPAEYIDNEIELIVFPRTKMQRLSKLKNYNISTLGGSLNKYSNPTKIQLEDKAWEMHIMDKYKTFDKKLNKCILNITKTQLG